MNGTSNGRERQAPNQIFIVVIQERVRCQSSYGAESAKPIKFHDELLREMGMSWGAKSGRNDADGVMQDPQLGIRGFNGGFL